MSKCEGREELIACKIAQEFRLGLAAAAGVHSVEAVVKEPAENRAISCDHCLPQSLGPALQLRFIPASISQCRRRIRHDDAGAGEGC